MNPAAGFICLLPVACARKYTVIVIWLVIYVGICLYLLVVIIIAGCMYELVATVTGYVCASMLTTLGFAVSATPTCF